jgi:hypothetical protein
MTTPLSTDASPPGGPARSSRRSLIVRGLFGGALLLVGGTGFLLSRGTRRVKLPEKPLSVLGEDEYAVVHALAERMVMPAPDAPTLEEMNTAWQVDQLLALADPAAQKEVKQLLGLFESALGGFLFGLRTRPFTQLSPAEQDEVLHEWQQSGLALRRTGFQALKTLVVAAYYATSKTWAYMGYPGPPAAFHDPSAPVWKGNGQPRPDGPGVFREEPAAPEAAAQEKTP